MTSKHQRERERELDGSGANRGTIVSPTIWQNNPAVLHLCFIITITIEVIIIIIIITRPKPPYGRQGLAGSWGKDTVRWVHFG